MKKGYTVKSVSGFSVVTIHNTPQPLSFSDMAVSTTEPAMGASTHALGNQR